MSSIALSESQVNHLIDTARDQIVSRVLQEHGCSIRLISKSQAAGLLDVDTKTLDSLKIPRVVISGKKIAYRLSDIEAFIARSIEN